MNQFNSSTFYSIDDFENSLNYFTIVKPVKIQFIGNTVNYTAKHLKGITSLSPTTEKIKSDIKEAEGVPSEIAHGQVILNDMLVHVTTYACTHACMHSYTYI